MIIAPRTHARTHVRAHACMHAREGAFFHATTAALPTRRKEFRETEERERRERERGERPTRCVRFAIAFVPVRGIP